MGRMIPPLPLSSEEVNRRISHGAKTMEEIDPEFCKWIRFNRRMRLTGIICILIEAVIIAIVFISVT